jgi:hypothetical protein
MVRAGKSLAAPRGAWENGTDSIVDGPESPGAAVLSRRLNGERPCLHPVTPLWPTH